MLLGIVVGAAVLAVMVAACAQSQAPSGGGGNEVTTASGLKFLKMLLTCKKLFDLLDRRGRDRHIDRRCGNC